uniref:Uncharacterized protein n=1 Tax=Anguilla anguilla TaxID=7936 RepID=A0A0E9PT65_ANGAN
MICGSVRLLQNNIQKSDLTRYN